MAKRTINVSLSESSIQGAIRQLQLYKQTLQYKCELLVERLAELGDKAAIMSVNESPLGRTGQVHAWQDTWWFWDEQSESWKPTHGVKATMPMYNAAMEIINQYKQIAREVFG